MLLFVGLGNPGTRYAGNRHNIGFMVLDAIAERHRIAPPWRVAFSGMAAAGEIVGERVLLLKPTTYMNDSGRAVSAAARYYRLQRHDILVFHDEVDLPPGKVRVKIGGTDSGHNGLRSITAHIGSEYRRVRIGVGHPGVKDIVHAHVLSDFAKSERAWVTGLCEVIADNAGLLAKGQDASFQNKVHLAMESKGLIEAKKPAAPKE